MEREATRDHRREELAGQAEDEKFRATDYGQREQDQGVPQDLNMGQDDDATVIGATLPVKPKDEEPEIAR